MSDELPLYQIANYNRFFENNKSRPRDRCGFVCVPNKHGGQGLTAMLNSGPGDRGAASYTAWQMMLQYSSRQLAPREGYLTADGSKDGGRLCVAEMARMFKLQPDLIRHTLRVACEIGWILLVSGRPETMRALEVPVGVTAETVTGSDVLAVTPSVLNEDTERKKERKNFSLSGGPEIEDSEELDAFLPQRSLGVTAEVTAETVTVSDRRSDREPGSPILATTEAETDLIQHAEAKRIFAKLSQDVFGRELRENQWSSQMEHQLDEALPLKRDDWESIAWFYGLPANHEAFTFTYRRQSIEALIENLSREVQKVWSVRKKLGLAGLPKKIAGANGQCTAERDRLTPECVAVLKRLYGDDVTIPQFRSQLPPSVRDEIEAALKEDARHRVNEKNAA